MTQGRNGLGGASSGFGSALTTASDEDKIKSIQKAAAQGMGAVNTLLEKSRGTLSSSVTSELESLKTALKDLKSVSSIATDTAASVSALKDRLDKVSKQV
jgi:hypothetical protein